MLRTCNEFYEITNSYRRSEMRRVLWDPFFDRTDEAIERLLRLGHRHLKPAARICLLSTFFDDGIRMIYQFGDQTSFFIEQLGAHRFFSAFLALFLMLGQLIPSTMILKRLHVRPCIFVLLGVVIVQLIAYNVLWTRAFLLKNFSVVGSLVLLLAETSESAKQMFAGLPASDTVYRTEHYLQLAGRVLIVLMFGTTLAFDSTIRCIFDALGVGLVALVTIGLKTKVASFALMLLLAVQNVLYNAFWMIPRHNIHQRDFALYHFFQTTTVIGGLLLVTVLGPGGVSIDQHKKDF